eukprot:7935388-Pyramimonas_sp.AAC.1
MLQSKFLLLDCLRLTALPWGMRPCARSSLTGAHGPMAPPSSPPSRASSITLGARMEQSKRPAP